MFQRVLSIYKEFLFQFQGFLFPIPGIISLQHTRALDPDSESTGASVRRLRIKLRDNYVKLHPDSYAGLFPYDAFIDDWNEGNEFDM